MLLFYYSLLFYTIRQTLSFTEQRAIRACVHTAEFPCKKKYENIMLVGSSGTGKTHLATAIGIEAAKHRKSVYFITCQELMIQLKKVENENSESSKIKDPEKILLRDQKLLNKEISKWMDISSRAKDQLNFLKDLYDKNSKAIIYYGDLSKEEKEQFKDPLKWRDTPEMSYVMKMADLF